MNLEVIVDDKNFVGLALVEQNNFPLFFSLHSFYITLNNLKKSMIFGNYLSQLWKKNGKIFTEFHNFSFWIHQNCLMISQCDSNISQS
jgi:hypothetical protein